MNRERIAKWDNIKFFMMLSVVIGHTLYNFLGSSGLAKEIYLFIYTYHMPVFIFVAGLFSKRAIQRKRYEKIMEYLLIYIVIKFLESFGDYLEGSKIQFHFFYEDGPAWFALAIAAFLFLTILVKDMDCRYVFAFALLVGCVAGLDTHLHDHLASTRICVFYPVFLAGYYLDSERLEFRELTNLHLGLIRCCSSLVLLIILLLSVIKGETLYPLIKLLKGKFDYFQMGWGFKGVLFRAICYLFWALMILLIVCANSNRERIYTWLGKRTMSIFIWHNFLIVLIFRVFKGKRILKNMMPHTYVIGAICMATIICIVAAYLPEIRVPSSIKRKNSVSET